jgi:energy-coupling factor transporter ATP-binding protein EcfA2
MNQAAANSTLPQPQTWRETGLRRDFLEGLALKILFLHGELLLRDLAAEMCLNLAIIEEIFQILRREHLIEAKGVTAGNYQIVPSDQGKTRALQLLALNQYSGPAPVPLSEYTKRVREQSVQGVPVDPADLKRAFSHLVVSDDVLNRIGTAVVSGTSILFHGPTGTGKTTLADLIPDIYPDSVWIPHCVEVDNQIISIFDATIHRPTEQPAWDTSDSRWVRCRRPRVLAGGELTAEMLELQVNSFTKFYSAPLQLKANNGVLVIDDLGRQRIPPEVLLNRWIVPLDRRIDFLTLGGGRTFEVPFDLFLVFSTNLDLAELADGAFLRRIPNKIKVKNLTVEQFHEIAKNVCGASQVAYDAAVIDRLVKLISDDLKQPLRACHPRDIVAQICWAAKYKGMKPELDASAIEQACRNYFVESE